MRKALARWVFFSLMGWKEHVTVAHYPKCILAIAPHTSNWDFFIAQLYYSALGRKASFLMKKEWFFPPLSWVLRWMGGISVERQKKARMTETLALLFDKAKQLHLAITPEGTRAATKEWRSGFYYVAEKAKIPILLYAIDFKDKCITCTEVIFPSGDIEQDMARIKGYYKGFTGKHPHLFAF